MARRSSGGAGRSVIDRDKWDKMLKAYRDRPTKTHVMEVTGVGRRIAYRAIMEGWPDQGLPPFVELEAGGTSVHKEMAKYRESWEESAITQGEAARQAAEEAMAARVAMDAALKAARMAQGYASKVLEKLESDEELEMPDITPKVIYQLTRALESSATIVEKAMKIEQMRAGKPEAVLGIEIGILLERCSVDELDVVIQTGEVPARIIDQRRVITAQLASAGETDAEAAALAAVEEMQDEDGGRDEGLEVEYINAPERDEDAGRDESGETQEKTSQYEDSTGQENTESAQEEGTRID